MINEEERFHVLLNQHLAGIRVVTDMEAGKLYDHYRRLVLWNKILNLTAIQDTEEATQRHYGESIIASLQLPAEPVTVLDIGSGGGFPGIPIAVLRPDCQVTLVESRQRKGAFLKECARQFSNVHVEVGRAEQVGGAFDWIVSRAVAPKAILAMLPRLSERIILMVGAHGEAELRKDVNMRWHRSVSIPWSRATVVVVGKYVPRGTDQDEVSRGT